MFNILDEAQHAPRSCGAQSINLLLVEILPLC